MIFVFIICLKQFFLGTTQFRGHYPQMPPVATGLSGELPSAAHLLLALWLLLLRLQILKRTAVSVKRASSVNQMLLIFNST